VRARLGAGEKVIGANTEDALYYYYADAPFQPEGFWLGVVASPDRLAAKWDRAIAGAHGVWVILSRAEDLDPRDAFAGFLDRRYPAAERFRFEGVRVWHVRAGEPAPAGAASP
jgi:hypothetical protein